MIFVQNVKHESSAGSVLQTIDPNVAIKMPLINIIMKMGICLVLIATTYDNDK